VHYLNVKLAKELGDDQPMFLVMLTKTDIESLGARPSLSSIASCLIRKIMAVQPRGPYNIAGLCIGAVLGYEIACQLRAAGHEVSLLVLLDAPSPSYLRSYNSLASQLIRPGQLWDRMMRLGLRETLFNFRKRLMKYLAGSVRARFAWSEIKDAQGLIEAAAFKYHPKRYEGEVLLLLASKRTRSVDFLPGWRTLVRNSLRTAFVDGHHRELMTPQNVRSIAEIILSHLTPEEVERENERVAV
jgi:thioesterase domain-containing protein